MTMPRNLSPEQQVEWKKAQVLRVKQWVIDNPDKARHNKRKYYEKNKDAVITAADEWRKQNPEAHRKNVNKYRSKHKERILEQSRKRYQDNREKLLEYFRLYREKNPELVASRVKASQRKNPLRLRIAKYTRRAREKTGSVTVHRVRELILEQLGRCNYCSVELVDFHIDHIMPLALGGMNDDSNIQLLCPKCNRKKGAKHPCEFNYG